MNEAWKWTLMGGAVGDLVVVENRDKYSLHRITRATETSVTLDDGSRWTWYGKRWGQPGNSYTPRSRQPIAHLVTDAPLARVLVAQYTAKAALRVAQLDVYNKITECYSTLTEEQAEAILAVLQGAAAPAVKEPCPWP